MPTEEEKHLQMTSEPERKQKGINVVFNIRERELLGQLCTECKCSPARVLRDALITHAALRLPNDYLKL
ncbi:hypothetical protein ACWJJH_14220 [Endozoicomonadaceae bacterium StTr2]